MSGHIIPDAIEHLVRQSRFAECMDLADVRIDFQWRTAREFFVIARIPMLELGGLGLSLHLTFVDSLAD